MIPGGGLEVSPSFNKSPKTEGFRGLIKTISAFSTNIYSGIIKLVIPKVTR
jgi:hypothetical protein